MDKYHGEPHDSSRRQHIDDTRADGLPNLSPAHPCLKPAALADLRYTKFRISGLPGDKHAVFVPDHLALTIPTFKDIASLVQKELPSMLLCGISSLCHPSRMTTPKLRKCQGFADLMQDASASLGVQKAGPQDAKLVEVVNHVVEKKLVSAVGSVASAAFRTNVWTFSGPQISNFEVLLQQSFESGDAGVFRLVAAHSQDRAYMEHAGARNLMRDLFESSITPGLASFDQPLLLPGNLWDPSESPHSEFARHGFDFWSFDDFDHPSSRQHPITLWPWPHGDLFLLYFREESGTSAIVPEADWQFSTRDRLDRDAVPFDPEMLAPVAHVVIGSPQFHRPGMKKQILTRMKAATPVVILDNTPNVAKQLAAFVNIAKMVWERAPITKCRRFFSDAESTGFAGHPTASELLQAMSPSEVLREVERKFDGQGIDTQDKLTLSDVVELLDIIKRRPQAFRETVHVLDPLQETPDQSMHHLMSVFTSYRKCTRETHTSAIHRSLVTKGWSLHCKLERSADHLHRRASILMMAIFTIMFLSTSLAMFLVHSHLEGKDVPDDGLLHYLMLLLPISTGILMVIQSNFQMGLRWASAHMASSRVVLEVYQFLGGVGPYVGGPTARQRIFLRRLRDMVKHLFAASLLEDEVEGSLHDSAEPFSDADALTQHVQRTLYGIQPPCWLWKQIQTCLRHHSGPNASCGWAEVLLDSPEMVDMTAPVSAEEYMERRVMPLRKYYSRWVRSLSRLRMVLHFTLLFALLCCVMLGAGGYSTCIPVVLTAATLVTMLSHWVTPPEVVTAINAALTTLNSLDLRWQGSDLRENRSDATKEHLVCTTEKTALAVARAYSRATLLPDVSMDDDGVSEDDEDGRLGEDLDERTQPISVSVPGSPGDTRSDATFEALNALRGYHAGSRYGGLPG